MNQGTCQSHTDIHSFRNDPDPCIGWRDYMRSDVQQTVDRQMVKYIVQRNIFCPVTGAVLDVRTCKWFVDKDGDPAYVLSPEAYDAAVSQPNIVAALAEKGLYPQGGADDGYCGDCRVPEHPVCSLTPGCRCCDDTIDQME